MGGIVITEHVTLDGVVEGFGREGWQFPVRPWRGQRGVQAAGAA
jgi:hypothetical protein